MSDEIKRLSVGDSVQIRSKSGVYWAMVVRKSEDSITFATENFAKSTCKYSNYGKTWCILPTKTKPVFDSDSLPAMQVNVENGIIRATVSTDPDYPGIDVEYIADYEHPLAMSRPRILMEKPKGEEIRVLAWEDKNKEDYTSEINFS